MRKGRLNNKGNSSLINLVLILVIISLAMLSVAYALNNGESSNISSQPGMNQLVEPSEK